VCNALYAKVRHGKPRFLPYCRVLPPGEFKSMILLPLLIDPESFIMPAATVFGNVQKHRKTRCNYTHDQKQISCWLSSGQGK